MFLTRLLRISLFNSDCAALFSEKTNLAAKSHISVRIPKKDHQEWGIVKDVWHNDTHLQLQALITYLCHHHLWIYLPLLLTLQQTRHPQFLNLLHLWLYLQLEWRFNPKNCDFRLLYFVALTIFLWLFSYLKMTDLQERTKDITNLFPPTHTYKHTCVYSVWTGSTNPNTIINVLLIIISQVARFIIAISKLFTDIIEHTQNQFRSNFSLGISSCVQFLWGSLIFCFVIS